MGLFASRQIASLCGASHPARDKEVTVRAVEVLAEEHRSIACVLDGLERLLRRNVRGEAFDGETAAEILEYLEQVVGGSHQEREEQVVFPRLLERTTSKGCRFVEPCSETTKRSAPSWSSCAGAWKVPRTGTGRARTRSWPSPGRTSSGCAHTRSGRTGSSCP